MPHRFVATEEQRRHVRLLAGFGMKHERIAQVVGVGSTTTLRKHFREELTRGPAEAMAKVRKTLLQMATSGRHPAATMYWLKRRAGWSEKGRVPEEEKPPAPVKIIVDFVTPPRRSEDDEEVIEPQEETVEHEIVTHAEFVARMSEPRWLGLHQEVNDRDKSPIMISRDPAWRRDQRLLLPMQRE
jgi:hypothetical protein